MIVSAVADPTAFGPRGIIDELSKREAIAFLHGIIDNGVLLDEPSRALLRESLSEVSQLGTKMGQTIQLLLLEIQKQHKKFVVTCERPDWQGRDPISIPEKCCVLADVLKADAVIARDEHLGPIQAGVSRSVEVVAVSNVSQSRFESKRRAFMRIDRSLDQLNSAELDDLIGRSLKYASTIRFLDYRMVGSTQRASRYLEGIRFFVTLWDKWRVVGRGGPRTIELYTVGESISQGGFLSGAEADSRLEQNIAAPLAASVSATVRRFVKKDSEPAIFHTRGFEALKRAYTLDPGFDAVGLQGPIRRCLLKLDLAAEGHFAECQKLKDLP